jgi:hypothetical protein
MFPGSLSHGLKGESPRYCGWHFRCDDPLVGEEIVRQSERWDGKPESYLEMRYASMHGTRPRKAA